MIVVEPRNVLSCHIHDAAFSDRWYYHMLDQPPVLPRGARLALCFRVLSKEPFRQRGDGRSGPLRDRLRVSLSGTSAEMRLFCASGVHGES
jgi:hypothetical protein